MASQPRRFDRGAPSAERTVTTLGATPTTVGSTVPPRPSAAGTTTTTTGKPVGPDTGPNSEYCLLARATGAGSSQVPRPDSTPAELRRVFEQAEREAQQAADTGPALIKGDLETVAKAISALTAALRAVDYERADVSPSAITAASAPRVQMASANVQRYNQTVCNITPS